MSKRNWGCRISADWTYKGYKALVLENEVLRVTVLPDKGSDIVEFLHKPTDTDFMWSTPWGLLKKGGFEASSAHSGGAFGDRYEGGWQDIFPSGGVANKHQGVEYGLHGEASLLAWDCKVIKDTGEEVAAELTVECVRSPFTARKVLRLKKGVGALYIEEELTNTGKAVVEAMWGHHPAFGAPFLSPDCRVDLPGAVAQFHHEFSENARFSRGAEGKWPRLKGKDGKLVDLSAFPPASRKCADMFYLKALKGNWYGLTNTRTKAGFGLCWDLKTFPYIWFWQVYGGAQGQPFWGRTYNCALEPFSSIPSGLANASKAGTALKFKPGQTRKTWLTAVAYGGRTKVKKIRRDGKVS